MFGVYLRRERLAQVDYGVLNGLGEWGSGA
jgi:hypothetical protein